MSLWRMYTGLCYLFGNFGVFWFISSFVCENYVEIGFMVRVWLSLKCKLFLLRLHMWDFSMVFSIVSLYGLPPLCVIHGFIWCRCCSLWHLSPLYILLKTSLLLVLCIAWGIFDTLVGIWFSESICYVYVLFVSVPQL